MSVPTGGTEWVFPKRKISYPGLEITEFPIILCLPFKIRPNISLERRFYPTARTDIYKYTFQETQNAFQHCTRQIIRAVWIGPLQTLQSRLFEPRQSVKKKDQDIRLVTAPSVQVTDPGRQASYTCAPHKPYFFSFSTRHWKKGSVDMFAASLLLPSPTPSLSALSIHKIHSTSSERREIK